MNRFLKKVSSKLSPPPASTPSPASSSSTFFSSSSSSSPYSYSFSSSSSSTTDAPAATVVKHQLDTGGKTSTAPGVDTARPSFLSSDNGGRRSEKTEESTTKTRRGEGEDEEEDQSSHPPAGGSSREGLSRTSSAGETQPGERERSTDPTTKGGCLIAGNLLDEEARKNGGGIGRGRGRGDVPPGSGRYDGMLGRLDLKNLQWWAELGRWSSKERHR